MNQIKIVQKETFNIVRSAINKAVNLIKPTFGPSSNKVIISKQMNKMVVDDGVQIARDLELSDPEENAVWYEAKHTAIKTNDRVGDGTTGALIMLQAIIESVAKNLRFNGRKVETEIKKGLEEATTQLKSMAQPVKTLADLEKVARISFDDEKVSKMIASTWHQLGKDGMVTVDRSGTMETFPEITEGIKIRSGFISPYMITDPNRMEAVFEKPYILMTDYRITEVNDILPVMNLLASKNILNLVIIAEHVEGNALATLIVNKLQGKFNTIAINTPVNGPERTSFLEDLRLMIGGKVFSEGKGDKIETCTIEDLGRATRFISRSDGSVIVGPRGKKEDIANAISSLNKAIESAKSDLEKDKLKERLARMTNKIAVIKVGAPTEAEERALRYKIDDSIHATHAAFKGGVVAGGGMALASLETSSPILNEALKAPFKQLIENVGLDAIPTLAKGQAFNVVTGKTGKFNEVGVMDPVDVLIAGIESAVSIASILLTSSGMIVEIPEEPKQ